MSVLSIYTRHCYEHFNVLLVPLGALKVVNVRDILLLARNAGRTPNSWALCTDDGDGDDDDVDQRK